MPLSLYFLAQRGGSALTRHSFLMAPPYGTNRPLPRSAGQTALHGLTLCRMNGNIFSS